VSDPFAVARSVADAVLDEGHVLYPYRASAMKNRMRWQFGILGPPSLEHQAGAEASWCRTRAVARAEAGATLTVAVRWLQPLDVGNGGWQGSTLIDASWAVTAGAAPLCRHHAGTEITVETESHPDGWLVVQVDVRNADEGPGAPDGSDRSAVLARSRVGVHVMLAIDPGRFVSSVDPPERARALVDPADNIRTWPVLVGASTMLSCPVILYDQPALAPEVDSRSCDSLEIEELLALRVATLTPAERREAATTDPVAAALVARHANVDAETQWALHGRSTVSAAFGPGAAVVLRPTRRADAQDMFLAGRRAVVIGHETSIEGEAMVRVVLADDPGRDLQEWHGRSWFFGVDEVEPA
jgi:hypothetical protein